MATQLSNRFKKEVLLKTIDLDTDSLKICLMAPGYAFNRATHSTYADVSASEVATANGYTVDDEVLANSTIVQDDVNNAGVCTFDNVSWAATGGSIIACGAIIYDDTHANNVVVGYIDLGGTQTAQSGSTLALTNITVSLG